MTQFGSGTIANAIDGVVLQPMQPPIGFGPTVNPPYHRPTFLNGAIGSGVDQVVTPPERAQTIAAQDTPAMRDSGAVLEWHIGTGTWAPDIPPVTSGTGSAMSAPVANRVQMTLAPAGLYEDIVVGTLLTCSAATGTPEAIAALNSLVSVPVLAPHIPGSATITLAYIEANLIDWTGATCTVTKT